jgi:cysteine dioxygenase
MVNSLITDHPLSRQRLHEELGSIMARANLSVECIKKYSNFCNSKPYTRQRVNLVEGQYELLVLCWNPGKGSKIHDHPGDGCYVRLIQGKLEENLYRVVDAQENLELCSSTIISAPAVTYMDDSLGVHRLTNPDAEIGAISLHLYTPPTVRCKVREPC